MYVEHCNGMIVDENQLSSVHNILSITKFESNKQTPKQYIKMAIFDMPAPISA